MMALVYATEDRVVRDLGERIELPHPARKRPEMLQPPCPRVGIAAAMTVASGPLGHDIDGQRSTLAQGLEMTCEAAQGKSRSPKRIAKAPSLAKVLLDP
jgi:hypothetical protein